MGNQIVAFGYTGGLVIGALRRRGLRPVLVGRDTGRLARLTEQPGGLDYRVAEVSDPASVRALVEPVLANRGPDGLGGRPTCWGEVPRAGVVAGRSSHHWHNGFRSEQLIIGSISAQPSPLGTKRRPLQDAAPNRQEHT